MSKFLQRAAAQVNGQIAQATAAPEVTEVIEQTPVQGPEPEPVVEFPLSQIDGDTAAQVRVMMSRKVDDYVKAMSDPDQLAEFYRHPVHLYRDPDSGVVRISRGFTRVAAARLAGLTTFPALVRVGTVEDAIWNAFGSNATHGDGRNEADLAKELRMILLHPEWGKLSDREIGRRVKCSHKTVGAHRQKLIDAGELGESGERVRKDKHGNTSTINVTGITAANVTRTGTVSLKDLDAQQTYSVINRALAQVAGGVVGWFAWLREHDAPEQYAGYLAAGYRFDERTFASQWQRAYDELAAKQPKPKAAPVAPVAPVAPAAPVDGGDAGSVGSVPSDNTPSTGAAPVNGRFVAPVAPGVEYNRRAFNALGNLSVYLQSVLDDMPVVSGVIGDGVKGYMSETKVMLARVNDLLAAMEADRSPGDDGDDGDTDADAESEE